MNMPFTPLGTLPHLQPGVVTVPQRDLTPSLAPLTPRDRAVPYNDPDLAKPVLLLRAQGATEKNKL